MKFKFLLLPFLCLCLYSCNKTEKTEYNKDGTLKKRTVYITSDKSNYREFGYYKNETLKDLQEFEDGIKHGRSFSYYENGNIKSVFYYDMGRITGIGRYYNDQGQLTDKGLFINDSMVVKEEFFYDKDLLKVNVFSKINGNFGETGSLLYNNKGLFGMDNSYYYIVTSADSIASGDSLKVSVDFIGRNPKGTHMSLSLGTLDENLHFLARQETYPSDSLSLSFYYKPTKTGYNLILGKLILSDGKPEQDKDFVFYHDFLVY